MKISVVMTTYNGARFLTKQLDSLRKQTRVPDEVLIYDDCSSDDSEVVVRSYIRLYQIEGWKVIRNEKNLGWKANFMQGFKASEGDLIFPCDQDDVWAPDKIEVMAREMEANTDINILACDVSIKYGKGAARNKHYEGAETREEGAVVQYPLKTSFFMNPRPGCTYAIRRTFFNRVKDSWQKDFPHDEYLWICAALEGSAYFINRKLVRFYRHSGNSSDVRYKDINLQKKQLDYIGRALNAFSRMINDGVIHALPEAEELVDNAKLWCRKRKRLMETRNPLNWVTLAPWWGYYNSPANAFSDVYLVVFGRFRR